MPKWMKPSEERPPDEVEVGDRIVGIVEVEENNRHSLRIVVLEMTEFHGWKSLMDDLWIDFDDLLLWSPERSVCAIWRVIEESQQ